MYENIKYEELKQLPDNQKKEALQELMATYGSNKAIAEATGAATIAIANLYGKIVEGKTVGRKKGTKNSVKEEDNKEEKLTDAVIETPASITEEKPKRKYTKRNNVVAEAETQKEEIVRKPIILADLKSLSFTTSLSGDLSGEEVKARIIGIVNALLDDKTYSVNLQIDEK